MKLTTLVVLVTTTLVLVACGGEKAEKSEAALEETPGTASTDEAPVLETIDQRISYIAGINIATQFKRDGINTDVDALSLAIEDIKADKKPRLSEEESRKTITQLQARVQSKQQTERAAISEKNKAEGAAYLTKNGAKKDVVTTSSGLQYKEVIAGDGEQPTAEDTVTVHYKGTLIDGTVFDSSYELGKPVSFPVNGVIPGWVEALQLMNVGDKFELAIPSDLAYGANGTGANIGPNATLLFEVELLEITRAKTSTPSANAEPTDTTAE